MRKLTIYAACRVLNMSYSFPFYLKRSLLLSLLLCVLLPQLHAQNINRPNVQGPSGLSVNSFTGNLFYQRTDLYLPGQGMPIDLSFAYNSFRDTLDLGYGLGWTFNYGYRYYPDSAGSSNLIVERPDGRRDLYTAAAGGFLPPTGIFDTWTQPSAGVYLLTTKYGMKYFFEDAAHKQLTRMLDPNGNELTFAYTNNRLTQITHSNGRSVSMTWQNGHLFRIADANVNPARQILFFYELGGLLTNVLNPLFQPETYAYDPNNRMVSLVDRNQNATYVVYNAGGQVRRIKSCESEMSFTYYSDQFKTYVTEQGSGGNQLTSYEFDSLGNVLHKKGNCCGFDTRYGYDTDQNVASQVDGNGNQTQYSYDADGNALLMADALGGTRSFAYEPTFNNLTQLTDKRGNTTSFTYNAQGNLSQISRPLGITEQYSYNGSGQVSQYTDANSHSTSFTYNGLGDLTQIQYPIGSESFVYDGVGNLTQMTNPNGHSLSMSYDVIDRLTQMTDPLGHQQRFEYDGNDNLTQVIDENGNAMGYVYDGLDRLVAVEDAVGTTQYGYDGVGNLTQMTNANGNNSAFEYNGDNLLVSESDPEGNQTQYTYDSNRNLIQRMDPNGQTTTYSYDALNRLTARSYPGNSETFSYDAEGNLTAASNNGIQMIFTYDALNRLTSKTVVNWGKTVSYTYDAAGNRASMTDPDGGQTTYSYDANNRLIQITAPGSGTTSFSYDPAGRLTQQTNGNGTYAQYFYDNADRVDSILHKDAGGAVLLRYAYTYDARGNRLSMTDNSGVHSYGYDALHRLDSVSYADGSTEYFMYDATGNRTSLVKNGLATQYSYDAADRIQSAGQASFAFDANGNMISRSDTSGTTTYTYDGQDRLTLVTLPGGQSVSYAYDPFGNRLSMTDTTGQVTRYFLDGANPLMEFDLGGQTQARYTSGLSMDSWLSMSRGGQTYYYHQDALGSVKALTDGSQGVAASYDYDAFGTIRSQSGNVVNPFTYTGREWDAQAGLYYYRTRYYDAEVGRFVTRDGYKIDRTNTQSLNRYTYVQNSSIQYSDPSGRILFLVVPVISWVATGAAWELGTQLIKNRGNHNCIDWADVGIGAIFGKLGAPSTVLDAFASYIDVEFSPDGLPIASTIVGARTILKSSVKRQFTGKTIDNWVSGSADNWLFEESWSMADKIATQQGFNAAMWVNGTGVSLSQWGLNKTFNNVTDSEKCDPNRGMQENIDDLTGLVYGWAIPIIAAYDPNEIVGPAGYDSAQWVSVKDTLNYTVFFENDPDFATAPAQVVEVYLPLDPHVNPFSLRLHDFGFGDFDFQIPAGSGFYQTRLDVSDSLGVLVDFTAGLDFGNNRAFWRFEALDPATLLPPTDATLGFLPVNDSIRRLGEGYARFSVVPLAASQTGDTIFKQAEIYFDDNPPIFTNTYFNTIDALPPTLTVAPVAALVQDSFQLDITFADDSAGSGTESYDLYLSIDGEPIITLALGITQDTSIRFEGRQNREHCVYSLARDNVVNILANTTNPLTCFLVRDTAYVDLTVPGGGEQYCVGDTVGIRWDYKNVDLVTLEYSPDGGATFFPLADSLAASDTAFQWVLTSSYPVSSTYLIKAISTLEDTLVNLSEQVFSVGYTPAPTLVQADTAICAGDLLSLSVQGTYDHYLWSTGDTTATLDVSAAGVYSLSVVGANGCPSDGVAMITLTLNPLPAQPLVLAGGALSICQNDSVTLSGPTGFDYLWSTGDTLQNLTTGNSGNYSLQVIDANGCVSPASLPAAVMVNPLPVAPQITASDTLIFCQGDSVSLSGPAGFGYLWSTADTAQILSVSQSGTFTLSVVDVNGCVSPASLPVVVTVNPLPPIPVILPGGNLSACAGDTLLLSAPAGFSYLWSNGASTQQIQVASSGSYDLRIIDANGCENTSAVTNVSFSPLPAQPLITPLGSLTGCVGDTILLTGPAGYSYQWSSGDTAQVLSVLNSGTFSLVVVDSIGCESPAAVPVAVSFLSLPPQPTITTSQNPALCAGDSVTLFASAGDTYLWSTGDTTSSITVASMATLSLTVTDSNGCISPASDAVEVLVDSFPPQPLVVANGPLTFCEGADVQLVGPAGWAYLWSTGDTTESVLVSASGFYSLTVFSPNACPSPVSDSLEVLVNALPQMPDITLVGQDTFCVGDSSLLIASPGFAYFWSTGDTTGSISVTQSGVYSVFVQDSLGCESPVADSIIMIAVPLPADPVIVGAQDALCTGDTLILSTASASTYLWSTGDTTQSIAVVAGGNYSVSVSNELGCAATLTDSVVITEYPNPAQAEILLLGNDSLFASVVANGYQWFLDGILLVDSTQAIVATQSGNYTVIAVNGPCLSPLSLPVNVTVTDITKDFVGGSIRVYPNPNRGVFLIDGAFLQANTVAVSIYNNLSQVIAVMDFAIQGGILHEEINLSDQPEGIYFVSFQSGGKVMVQRVVIVH